MPAEIAAILGAMVGGLVTQQVFNNPILTALGGTWGENLGFYGKILFSDISARVKTNERFTLRDIFSVLRNAVIEFGVAEYFDSFLVRPLTMYLFTSWTNNVTLCLFLGKITADITFYLPTIFFYELRVRYLKN